MFLRDEREMKTGVENATSHKVTGFLKHCKNREQFLKGSYKIVELKKNCKPTFICDDYISQFTS